MSNYKSSKERADILFQVKLDLCQKYDWNEGYVDFLRVYQRFLELVSKLETARLEAFCDLDQKICQQEDWEDHLFELQLCMERSLKTLGLGDIYAERIYHNARKQYSQVKPKLEARCLELTQKIQDIDDQIEALRTECEECLGVKIPPADDFRQSIISNRPDLQFGL